MRRQRQGRVSRNQRQRLGIDALQRRRGRHRFRRHRHRNQRHVLELNEQRRSAVRHELHSRNSLERFLCGRSLGHLEGQNPPYGTTGYCNAGGKAFRTTSSGSGGPSGCATGAASTGGEVSGTCAGYPKPSWQAGLFGNPDDSVRDIPDVSLFAANGLWGHFYIICYSNTTTGGNPCTGNPDPTANTGATWNAEGGTSFAAPILAGIQALVNQRTAALTITPVPGQGNPNPVYYAIAASEYGASGSTLCNSSAQPLPRRGVATTCVFYDVTQGDIDLNCTAGSANCFDPSGTDGVLSHRHDLRIDAVCRRHGLHWRSGVHHIRTSYSRRVQRLHRRHASYLYRNCGRWPRHRGQLDKCRRGLRAQSGLLARRRRWHRCDVFGLRRYRRRLPALLSGNLRLGFLHRHRHDQRIQFGLQPGLGRRTMSVFPRCGTKRPS